MKREKGSMNTQRGGSMGIEETYILIQASEKELVMKNIVARLAVVLLGIVMAKQPSLAQFYNASATVSAYDDTRAPCLNETVGLLPQLNPPAAVIDCVDNDAPVGAAPVQIDSLAGGYPSNGMVSVETIVSDNALVGPGYFLTNGAYGVAQASVTDTYWPIPAAGAVYLRLALHFDGKLDANCQYPIQNFIPCDGAVGAYLTVGSTDSSLLGPPQVIDGGPIGNVIFAGFTPGNMLGTSYDEQVFTAGPTGGVGGIGQDFTVTIPWIVGISPSGLEASFIMSNDTSGYCNGVDLTCLETGAFENTLQVTHADVLDSNGNVIPGAAVGTASGFNPNAVGGLAFSNFTGKMDVSTSTTPPSFQFNGGFTLGSGSTGINPVLSGLTLTVGSYSVLVPASSVTETKKGRFVYQGTIHGSPLQFRIAPTATNTYSFQVDASNASISLMTNPVPVKLVIGNNVGTAQINAQFQ
jgi:hypothetical protein